MSTDIMSHGAYSTNEMLVFISNHFSENNLVFLLIDY